MSGAPGGTAYARRRCTRSALFPPAASTAMTTSCDLGCSGCTGCHWSTSGGPGLSKTIAFGTVGSFHPAAAAGPPISGEPLPCFGGASSVVSGAGKGCTVEVFMGDGLFDGAPPQFGQLAGWFSERYDGRHGMGVRQAEQLSHLCLLGDGHGGEVAAVALVAGREKNVPHQWVDRRPAHQADA